MKIFSFLLFFTFYSLLSFSQQTQKPPLHGKNWMAVTGKPLAATAGSMIFQQGGNAVDAAIATPLRSLNCYVLKKVLSKP